MNLKDLLGYKRIAIQCHDNPDADALASGFALFRYFETYGFSRAKKNLKFFYGGRTCVVKPSLIGMIEGLGIPVEHAPNLTEWEGLLISADCQNGGGNVMKVSAPHVAVIDHHVQEGFLPVLCDLRPWLGSCSTLVWKLLEEEKFPIDISVATALHYGLFSDTNGFSEIRHPLDRDMWDSLSVDNRLLKKLKRSNLSLNDLSVASVALSDLRFDEAGFVVLSAPSCDPNLLGFLSDLAMQADGVDLAVVYAAANDGIKFSVRTSSRETKASELAAWLARDLGSGGGHREKAGGYIAAKKYSDHFGDRPFDRYFSESLKSYLSAYRIVDCLQPASLVSGKTMRDWRTYRKLPVRLGFVPCSKLFLGKTDLQVRMLEGDMDIAATEDTVLMIGVKGEVYPTELEKFIQTYSLTGAPFISSLSYPPTVLNKNTGTRISLLEYAETCVASEDGTVQAMPLKEGVKVFTRWDSENYFRGDPGDWLVARSPDDLYVVTKDVFTQLYIRDCTGINVAENEHAMRVVKNDSPVTVTFFGGGGILDTLEGRVSYAKGDAHLVGVNGESWPIEKERFFETYAPMPGTEAGTDGKYCKKDLPAWALQLNEPFVVELSNHKGLLKGQCGDWLLQYAPDEYGVVSREIFEATYRRYPR